MQRVEENTGKVVVTLNRATVAPSLGLYLRSLLSETFARQDQSKATTSLEAKSKDQEVKSGPSWGRLEFGTTTNAVVVGLKEYGVVLKSVASSVKRRGGSKGGQLMVCPLEHAMEGLEEGNEVKVRGGSDHPSAKHYPK